MLFLGTALATTRRDALGLALVALAYLVVPWAAVWALAVRRFLAAAGVLALVAVGFALAATEGFPTYPAAALALALAAACAWRGRPTVRRAGRAPRARP